MKDPRPHLRYKGRNSDGDCIFFSGAVLYFARESVILFAICKLVEADNRHGSR